MSGYDFQSANVSCLNLNPQMIRDTYDQNVSDSGKKMLVSADGDVALASTMLTRHLQPEALC